MPRISEEFLRTLKSAVSIAEVVRRSGVELMARGDELAGCCPFPHGEGQDTTPSLYVNEGKGLFHCHGCGASGDVIAWVQKHRRLGFRRTVELLEQHGVDVMHAPAVDVDHLLRAGMSDDDVLDAVTRYYAQTFARVPDGKAYAEKRGIFSEALAQQFRFGFCDRTLAYRLPHRASTEGKAIRAQLETLGIMRETGHEAMRGCLTLCTLDENGKAVAMYGRKVLPAQRDTSPHMYLRGPHRGVFNLEGIGGQKEVILTEAIIDALTFCAAGITNVTTAYGVDGLTDETVRALQENQVARVLIAFDRDDAGDRGATAAAERLMALGMECLRVKFPRGMDANEYARKVTPASQSLRVVMAAAEWMGAGVSVTSEKAAFEEDKQAAAEEKSSTNSDEIPDATDEVELISVTPSAPEQPASSSQLRSGFVEIAPPPPTTDELPSVDAFQADEHLFRFGDRTYRVRGVKGNTTHMVLKVNVSVRSPRAYYMDTFDLSLAKPRDHFARAAAAELDVPDKVVGGDVGKMLERLEAIRDAWIEALKAGALTQKRKAPEMTAEDREDALRMLRDPKLVERIVDDLGRVGLVGERTNKLTGYIAAVSRKLERPLAIIIRSVSGAGKSSLMESILSLMPDEEIQKFSAMTSQSLYYFTDENDLRHKILALAEEEGAEKASYALKLLQSEGELTIASTGKDPASGRHVTREYHVDGPVMIFVTTTSPECDEEFLNRCLVLSVDESREQTRAIHEAQKFACTREGILQRHERASIIRRHRNAQRLLKSLAVLNPYGNRLTFPDHQTRTRRDLPKYLVLINAITLLHQHQREVRELINEAGVVVETVVTTLDDIALANRLATEILGQTLDDMQPQTRRLLMHVDEMVTHIAEEQGIECADVRVTQREIREYTGWGHTQLKVHLARLVDREFLIVHRTGPGQRYAYELFYDGKGRDGRPFVNGLIDVEELAKSELVGGRSAPGRGAVGGMSAPVKSHANGQNHVGNGAY